MKLLAPFVFFSIILVFACNDKNDQTESIINDERYNDSIINKSPHIRHEKKFGHINFTSEDQWDSLNNITHSDRNMSDTKFDNKFRTFGWHLYSNGSAYKDYNFSLLWGISYFAYIIEPETGSYKSIHQWKSTSMIDSAKKYDCNVFLTIGNFGESDNISFLNNGKSWKTLSDSIISLLKLRGAHGINIDFEGVPKKKKTQFAKFITYISNELKKVDSNYLVSLCLYAVDHHHIFDIKAIDKYIDFYTLMAYDYYGGFSTIAGPVTPSINSKNFGNASMESSVEYYLDQGVNKDKLIVALPFYGAEWFVNNADIPAKADKFKSHPTYRTIQRLYIDSLKLSVNFENNSKNSYINISENNNIRQLWFDDIRSLSVKFKWLKEQNINGVGIWALGYDNGYDHLWKLIIEEFGKEK